MTFLQNFSLNQERLKLDIKECHEKTMENPQSLQSLCKVWGPCRDMATCTCLQRFGLPQDAKK